jgi:hypothetical protein
MKHVGVFFGTVAALALAAVAAGTAACNGLLGISSASTGIEPGVNCSYYCQTINQNCTGADNTEYQGSNDLCMSMCGQLPSDMGTIDDTQGDTLGCRINYAQKAGVSDPASNCRKAGPLGGGVCGVKSEACNDFCQLDVPYCMSQGYPSYVSPTDCMNHCTTSGDSDSGTFVAGYTLLTDGGATGVDLASGGDSLNCRFYHLENAWPSKGTAETHCPHTMPISATCNASTP